MIYEIIFFLLILNKFLDVTKGKCISKKRLDGKTVLITGGTSGIGKETVRDLARRGARIIMASRRVSVGQEVKQEIIDETGNTNIIPKKLDISSIESIQEFAQDIVNSEEKIDILIHNSGITPTKELSVDGIPLTLATNLYGPFLLTHLLIDLVRKSDQGRIIFVSSLLAFLGKLDFQKLKSNGDIDGERKRNFYKISKYGMSILSNLLAKKLSSDNISVNSVHPGLVATSIFDNTIYKYFIKIFKFIFKTPEEGAQTQIYVAVDDHGYNNSGKFYCDCYSFNAFKSDFDLKNANVLWNKMVKLMKIKSSDPKI